MTTLSDLAPGTRVRTLWSFGCIPCGAISTVTHENGLPVIECRRGGHTLCAEPGQDIAEIGLEVVAA